MTLNDDLGTIVQGDDYTKQINVEEDGTAVDISGWEVWVTVKNTADDSDADAVIQKHVTSHDDAPNGQTSFTFTSSDTTPLKGHYVYDIQIKTAAGEVATVALGHVYFSEEVTQA